jgi:two-component system sensor histidine kinase YesM
MEGLQSRKNYIGHFFTLKIIFLFSICILPLLLCSLYLNAKSKQTVLDNTRKTMEEKVRFVNNMMEQEIYNIMYQSASLTEDNLLLRYASVGEWALLSPYETAMTETQIQNRAIALQNSNALISRVHILFPRLDLIFNTAQTIGETNPSSKEIINWLSVFEHRYLTPPIVFKDNKMYLIMWSKDYLKSSSLSQPSIISFVELSNENLLQSISKIYTYSEDSFYLYNDKDFFLSTNSKIRTRAEFNAIDKEKNYSFSTTLKTFNLHIDHVVPKSVLTGQFDKFDLLYIVIFAIPFVIISIFSFQIYRLIYKPFEILTSVFKAIETSNYSLNPYDNTGIFSDYFRILEATLLRLKKSINEVVEYKYIAKVANMKQLQSNMQPHFLYNSLFNISCLCKEGSSQLAGDMIEKLSKLFRFITKDENEYTTLLTELEYAKHYTDIQQMRFFNRITVQFDSLPKEFENNRVPRLIMQPFLENAYKYGFADCIDNGLLRVCFQKVYVSENMLPCLAVIIENSGNLLEEDVEQIKIGFKNRKDSDGAIANVNTRLKLFFGYDRDLVIERSEFGGLLVKFIVHHTTFWKENYDETE